MGALATKVMTSAASPAAASVAPHHVPAAPTLTIISLSVPLWVSIHLNPSPQIHLLSPPQCKDRQGSVRTCCWTVCMWPGFQQHIDAYNCWHYSLREHPDIRAGWKVRYYMFTYITYYSLYNQSSTDILSSSSLLSPDILMTRTCICSGRGLINCRSLKRRFPYNAEGKSFVSLAAFFPCSKPLTDCHNPLVLCYFQTAESPHCFRLRGKKIYYLLKF